MDINFRVKGQDRLLQNLGLPEKCNTVKIFVEKLQMNLSNCFKVNKTPKG